MPSFSPRSLRRLALPGLLLALAAGSGLFASRTLAQLDTAIAQARRAVAGDPSGPAAHARLGGLLLVRGRHREAEAEFRTALSVDTHCPGAQLGLAELCLRQYRFAEGEGWVKTARRQSPGAVAPVLLDIRCHMARMEFDAVERLCRELLAAHPGLASARYALAEAAYRENRYDDSLTLLDQCLEGQPQTARAWLLRSRIHRIRQETEAWKTAGRRAAAADPLDADILSNLADILMRGEGRMSEGQARLRMALELNPWCRRAHRMLGNGWTGVDYSAHSMTLPADPADGIEKDMAAARAAMDRRDYPVAQAAFARVLKRRERLVPALTGMGFVLYKQHRFRPALDCFFRALAIDPDYGLAHYGISQSLLRLQDAVNSRLQAARARFRARQAPEPSRMREVFVNYPDLDPELQQVLRLSVQPLAPFMGALATAGATFYIMPVHTFLWESPHLEKMRGRRTIDLRLWDDIKGVGGFHATSGEEWERDVAVARFNVVAHEFAHQVHGFLSRSRRRKIKALYLQAKAARRTLDFYADSNEWEYFAVGVEAFVSPEKLPDQKGVYGHTRRELQTRDPGLFRFIESLAALDSCPESMIRARIHRARSLPLNQRLARLEAVRAELGDHPVLLAAMADVCLETGQPEQARAWYSRARKAAAGAPDGYLGLARMALNTDRDPHAAAGVIQAGTAAGVDDPVMWTELGRMRLLAGEPDAAIQALNQSLKLDAYPDPYASRPYVLRARAAMIREDFRDAEKDLRFHLQNLNRGDAEARAELAVLLYRTGRESGALEAMKKARGGRDERGRVAELSARLRFWSGDPGGARSELEKALKKHPGRDRLRVQLAEILATPDPRRAESLARQVMESRTGDYPGRLVLSRGAAVLGGAAEGRKDYSTALARYRQSRKLCPLNYAAGERLVRLLVETKQVDAARSLVGELAALPAPEACLARCRELLEGGRSP